MPAAYDDPTAVVPPLDLPDRRPSHHLLHVSREATDVIAAGNAHIQALSGCYGYGSPQHRRAEQRLAARG